MIPLPNTRPLDIREEGDSVLFPILVRPRSRQNAISGIHDGALKVSVVAAPAEGAANESCRKVLAKVLGISTSNIAIVHGKTSSRKLVICRNASKHDLEAVVAKLM